MGKYLNLKPVELSALSAKVVERINWNKRIILPKWDGCFTIGLFDDGKLLSVRSRTGEWVRSLAKVHFRQASIPGVGRWAVLGEAWKPNTPHHEISGEFRRHALSDDLVVQPFDLVQWRGTVDSPELFSGDPYRTRLGNVSVSRSLNMNHGALDYDTLLSYATDWVNLHKRTSNSWFDGLIAADPDATYKPGSGKCGSFIKLKPLSRATLRVVGVVAAKGEKTGRDTVALTVRLRSDGTVVHCSDVGTGINHEQAERWAAHPDLIVGQLIDVDYLGLTPGGALREPRFVGIRYDVLQEDTV